MTIDVILRVLSFCNQVVTMTKRLLLVFEGGHEDTGYLDRMSYRAESLRTMASTT